MGDTGGALCISDNRSPYYEMPENFRFMLDDIDVSYEIDDFEWSTEDTFNAKEFKISAFFISSFQINFLDL